MNIKKVCKPRNIGKIDIPTPLLVPSFSSAQFDDIGNLHRKLREYITDASLVGGYDLHYENIKRDEIWVSDVVFIDSGTFEYRGQFSSKKLKDWTFEYVSQVPSENPKKPWSSSMYSAVIDALEPLSKVVLTNFDQKEPLEDQISYAKNLFSKYSDYGTCFLCRPTDKGSSTIDIKGLIENISLIKSFNILGITEKELGNSVLERCEHILMVRKALDTNGLMLPIHIFGCLDPLSILPYFLCGADIFDGLAWLKWIFHENVAIYINNSPLLTGNWSESNQNTNLIAYVKNCEELRKLRDAMRRFTLKYDLGIFGLKKDILKEIVNLTRTAGIEY